MRRDAPTVGYVMSRFPKLTETFVLFEILGVEEHGAAVEIHPLLGREPGPMHPEAAPLVAGAHYLPYLSMPILRSQLHHLRRRPAAYLRAFADMIRATWSSPGFLARGLVLFPKVAHMARQMSAEGVDHVHCHFASHPALAGWLVHRLAGIPYSFTAHGSDLHKDHHMLREKVAEAAFVVAISEDNRTEILAATDPRDAERVLVLHVGVDTRVFEPRGRLRERAAGATDGRLRIVCVGTLHEVKGQTHLVEAVRRLSADGLDVECRLVGGGPDRARLERQIADADLSPCVTLVGQLTRAELVAELRAADVLVAPSVPTSDGRREGIPVVLMEAMAAGLPVVASRLSGIPELVTDGETGLLVRAGDAGVLAAAIGRLARDPDLRARLGVAGRERILRDFDLRTNAGLLLERVRMSGATHTGRPPAAMPARPTVPRTARRPPEAGVAVAIDRAGDTPMTDPTRQPVPRGSSDEGQPGPEPDDTRLDPGPQKTAPGTPEHDQPAEGGREEVEENLERPGM